MQIDIVMEALESIDVAPRRSPAAEIALEFLNGGSERLQALLCVGLRRRVVVRSHAAQARLRRHPPPEIVGPENRKRGRDRAGRPAMIPFAQDVGRIGELRLQRLNRTQEVDVSIPISSAKVNNFRNNNLRQPARPGT